MEITELKQLYAKHPNGSAWKKIVADDTLRSVHLKGLCASAAPVWFASWQASAVQPLVFVLADVEEAGYFYHDLTQMLTDERVLFFPSSYRRAVKYGQKDPGSEVLRTEVLSRLQKDSAGLCVVTYPDALAEKVVSPGALADRTLRLKEGEQVDTLFIAEVLAGYGFERVDYVYEPGQYAVRGSIIDVFSFSCEYPYRIDFFGNEVESIRTFEVDTQLSKERKESIAIVPELRPAAGERGAAVSFFDFLPSDTLLATADYEGIGPRIREVSAEALAPAAQTLRAEDEGADPDLAERLVDDDCTARLARFRRIEFGHAATEAPQAVLNFDCAPQPIFHKNFDLVSTTFRAFLDKGYTLYICTDSAKQAQRIRAIFEERGNQLPFTAVDRTLHAGYVDNSLRCCFFTDHQVFDRFHKYNLKSDKARSGKVALSLKELNQFQPGDYVVHTDHGVGRFAGLVRLPVGDTTQEVMKLVFQNDDVVFVSIHALHKVSKYKGKEGEQPRLNKLGTGAWEKMKERTKRKIKDIARDLIRLYSRRREEKGYAFSPDSFLQHELEASFLYEDTPDQLKATQDVKRDMEQDRPMDRLVCGDVGFGKTEVAVRAAFKAVADNKQVAVLVPTTVLAYQHFQTFSERLKGFPCRVEYLSRARKPADTRRVLAELQSGEVNILVGTHRIIGKDVRFHDLGLLIIDEEQKFGVAVKEKLKQLKVNVDTLTLTATPIPRTLQFSLMGARDLSVISTPPPNRYPIQTEVHTFSEDIIREAVSFEMSRNGQVFLVNNRIQNLEELKALIERNVPDARVCIGHGQMEPEKLEKVILDFANYDYDVLVATTIIESGIDIPNANTILINQAQNYGLSDLHQMRGRVGRSNKKAFCYLLAPPLASLTPEAKRRLQAVENFSDLGSGIHIAMQDLDIRGAGNMLGAEQSGFIADLGYETYQKILGEAVKELKNEEFADLLADQARTADGTLHGDRFVDDCAVESDLELLFPAEYIPSSSERMALYRELDGLELDADVEAFRLRMVDRFGRLPHESEELLRMVPLRRLAKRMGVEKVFLKGGRMTLFFVSNPDSPYYQSDTFDKVLVYASTHPRECLLREQNGKRSMVIPGVSTVQQGVDVLLQLVAQ
ncbi:MAG: transcription-repair coupling factor [Bacteroidaceae bacterium]